MLACDGSSLARSSLPGSGSPEASGVPRISAGFAIAVESSTEKVVEVSWVQIIGLIAALLMGVYNTLRTWQDEAAIKKLETPQAVESVYEVEPGAPPPTDPGKP